MLGYTGDDDDVDDDSLTPTFQEHEGMPWKDGISVK